MSNLIPTIKDHTDNDMDRFSQRWSIVNSLCWSAASNITASFKAKNPDTADSLMSKGSQVIDICHDLWLDLGGTPEGFKSFFDAFVDSYETSEPSIQGLGDEIDVPIETWKTLGFNETQAESMASKPIPSRKYEEIKRMLAFMSPREIIKVHLEAMHRIKDKYKAELIARTNSMENIRSLGAASDGSMTIPEDIEDDIDKKIFDGLVRRTSNATRRLQVMAYEQDVPFDEIFGEANARKESEYLPDPSMDFLVGQATALEDAKLLIKELDTPLQAITRRIDERERTTKPIQEGAMH